MRDDRLLEWASRIYDTLEFACYQPFGGGREWDHEDATLDTMKEFVLELQGETDG